MRRVDPNGVITNVAGTGEYCYVSGCGVNGVLASEATFSDIRSLAMSPDGTLYILASDDYHLRKLRHKYPVLLDPSGFRMPSADGSELFEFDDVGRHIKTLDAFTGAQLYQFNLGSNNLLTSVQDSHGNTTTITRDSEGKALSILAHFGNDQSYTMTGLSINADGWLDSITNPASDHTSFSYSQPSPYTPAEGLLSGKTDPRGNSYEYQYDQTGYQTRVDGAGMMVLPRLRVAFAHGPVKVLCTSSASADLLVMTERQLSVSFNDGPVITF